MTVNFKITGLDKLAARLITTRTSIAEGLGRAAIRGGFKVQGEAVMLVQRGPKTGEVYKRRTVKHQASAPGEAPASDTGNLASNIVVDFIREGNAALVVVKSRAPYSIPLEFGTKNIEPRPFMRPAYRKHKNDIIKDIAKEVNQEIKRSDDG
jgi:HK97 gp10 family phage protein